MCLYCHESVGSEDFFCARFPRQEHKSRHSEDLSGCSCQYALGGGAVAPGGSYPQIQTTSVTCASELHKYLVRLIPDTRACSGIQEFVKMHVPCTVAARLMETPCCPFRCGSMTRMWRQPWHQRALTLIPILASQTLLRSSCWT